jgi:hypothetical protein
MATKTKPRNTSEIQNKGGSGPPITVPEEVKTEITGLKAKADELAAALANTPKGEEIASLQGELEAIKATVDNIPGNYEPLIKSLEQRVDELQTGAALLGSKANDQPSGIRAVTKSIEESAAYKSIIDNQALASPGTFGGKTEIESFQSLRMKAASPVTISDVSGQNLEVYRPGIFQEPRWAMNLATRFPTIIVQNATTYTIPYETDASEYGAWTSTLTAALDGDPTPKSAATFDSVDGLVVGSTVRFYDGDGVLLGTSVVVSYDTGTKVVTFTTDSLTWDADIGDRVTSENYGATAEEASKPYGWVGTANRSWNFKTLATIIPTTVNALRTVAGLQQFIEGKLPERDLRNMSWHLMYGDATVANQLQGLRTYTGAQTYSWSSGSSGDNQVDAVMRAANLIPWTAPIGVIMSQADLPSLYLLKGSDGHYLRAGNFGMVPLVQGAANSWFLGPYELVFDYAVTSTHFTVINWTDASEIVDQATAAMLWGYINDDFEKNIIRARYEATRLHAIKSTRAYVAGTWDAAP